MRPVCYDLIRLGVDFNGEPTLLVYCLYLFFKCFFGVPHLATYISLFLN